MAKINKSAFVRSLPADLPTAEVVKAAREKGITLTENYVATIRYNAKKAAAKKEGKGAPSAVPAKRGPGRPRKVASAGGGLESEFERIIERVVERKVTGIVERKVEEILRGKLGALFSR